MGFLKVQRNPSDYSLPETVSPPPHRKGRFTTSGIIFLLFLSLLTLLLLSRNVASVANHRFLRTSLTAIRSSNENSFNHVIREEVKELISHSRHVSSIQDSVRYRSLSILMPDWVVLVIVSPETPLTASVSLEGFHCLFSNNQTSQARFFGVLPFTERTTFRCIMPNRVRRERPFWQPILTKNPEKETPPAEEPPAEVMIRLNSFVYESISTENDIVLFVKGVNSRQGINRAPQDLRCVFGDESEGGKPAVKTPVTSSIQEVLRCSHPSLTAFASGAEHPSKPIKISLEIASENRTVPSVAYYMPGRTVDREQPKSLICACTMVHNVAKYLKEWVMYHSKIGVEKFILYDNDSDDNLQKVVYELNRDGYNVTTLLWLWPKTQESGFSHNAILAKDSCKWMMYIDVDEFVFSPSWDNSLHPSKEMLKSLLPHEPSVGQISVRCNDFGPSGQKSHPVEGVMQGYNCRRRADQQRHKSIVLLDAIDDSLFNVIHHFGLKDTFRWKQISKDLAVVNHYKYQAWPEFKAKFRRRVSAYVVDWRERVNPKSKDRTPGLGFQPIEPNDWDQMFCDVRDERLKLLTRRWFGNQTPAGFRMAWQSRDDE